MGNIIYHLFFNYVQSHLLNSLLYRNFGQITITCSLNYFYALFVGHWHWYWPTTFSIFFLFITHWDPLTCLVTDLGFLARPSNKWQLLLHFLFVYLLIALYRKGKLKYLETPMMVLATFHLVVFMILFSVFISLF